MQVTRDGAVTIPERIRRKLGITEATEVDFVEEDGKVVLTVQQAGEPEPIEAWLERVTGMTAGRMSTDEIMRLTRGDD